VLGFRVESEGWIRDGQDIEGMSQGDSASRIAEGPLRALARRCATEGLKPDAAQEAAAAALQRLHDALGDYRPPGERPRRGLLRLTSAAPRASPPRGLYLHGPVGRGKTMLMDLFFEAAPVARKRRVHFSTFMIEVHERLHRLRSQSAASGDFVPKLAAALAAEAWLLCLDELQIDNIGDAMLVDRLFTGLLDAGTVVVATSNWAPDELYAGGLQRERFLPFIALLKARLDVLCLDAATDYRRQRLSGMQVYHWPLDAAAAAALADAFALVTDSAALRPMGLAVGGRTLHVRRTAKGAAWFTFDELCGQPLGSADYLALAQRFHTIALEGIPLLTPERRDQARRLIALIDLLYENGTKFICSAAAPPDHLFDIARDARLAARAVSRLIEMQTPAYLAAGDVDKKSRGNVDPHLL
jgi:cell division protein ZapE